MSSPPKSSISPTRKQSSSVHQKLTSVINSSKPFMKSKSHTRDPIVFPTFRFSPESEEIQEVVASTSSGGSSSSVAEEKDNTKDNMEDSTAESLAHSTNSSNSSSSSTKSGGDVSPLKEYIMKHKWANKWDKRSLSLDLDLKGKLFTALEDKRKSFVSQFLNEEDEDPVNINSNQQPNIVQSCSIPEQLVVGLENINQDFEQDQDISVHSDTVLVRGSTKYNFDEENCPDYFTYDDEYDVVDDIGGAGLNPNDFKNLVVEEIGVDCCDESSGMAMRESLGLLKEFVLPPESLTERFEGNVTLYNPPGVVCGLRKFPIQEKEDLTGNNEEGSKEGSIANDEDKTASVPGTSTPVEVKKNDLSYYRFSGLLKSIAHDLIYHPWIKYLVGLFAVLMVLNFSPWFGYLVWFLIGNGVSSIVFNALWRAEEEKEAEAAAENLAQVDQNQQEELQTRRNSTVYQSTSQGWVLMLQSTKTDPYPAYNPFQTHLRDLKPFLMRLTGKYLTISTPHPRHRISKRRLWSDQPMNNDMIFVKHQQYDITNATVTIAPEGLAKKRVWCKKYPISITFNVDDKYCGELLNGTEAGNHSEAQSPSDDMDGKVSFSKESESVNVGVAAEEPKGEVFKDLEGCSGKTIYLFCRCDREKDDWIRRLVQATKPIDCDLSPDSKNSDFMKFMKNSCPSLANSTSRIATPTNDPDSSSPPSSLKSSPVDSINFTPHELVNPTFVNALIARLFYDFLSSDHWNEKVKKLIDRKLFFIRKPAFVQSLKVKNLEFGNSLPIINHASVPVLDQQGLWVDLDVQFKGKIVITLEAFINLMKIGSGEHTTARVYSDLRSEKPKDKGAEQTESASHAMFDSDADDSGESSESEEDVEIEEVEASKPASGTSVNERRTKLLKYADTFAKSSVMRNKHVQKVVTGIATTPLLLTVEINGFNGCVAVNIPPVPNDRVWMGFRTNPSIDINVRPKVGERVVSLSHVTSWIKKKILLEFQRVMVCPNMVDLTIPLMEFELPK